MQARMSLGEEKEGRERASEWEKDVEITFSDFAAASLHTYAYVCPHGRQPSKSVHSAFPRLIQPNALTVLFVSADVRAA